MHTGRAGLAVPALELRQQARQVRVRVSIGNGLRKIVAGHGAAVVSGKVQRHAGRKIGAANRVGRGGDQRLHHADDFGALFVNRHRVEIADLDIAVWPHRVGHGASVFRELRGAQYTHVFNTFDSPARRRGAQVHAELLVAKHGQAFFEAQLKPVAAGDAVACPVVKVLVADHAFNVAKVHIGCRGLVGQHVLGVEDVQALVFHRPHVEVAGGDDHETLEVQAQAKAGFIPRHRIHQRIHRVLGLVQVTWTHIHLQRVVLACAGRDTLLTADQLAGHQRKQIRGFAVRVYPLGKVAAHIFRPRQIACFHQVAVGQQHRVLGLVRAQRHGVAGHHVGAVQKISNAAKAFCLTLREKRVLADVQAHQLGVLDGCAGCEDFEIKDLVTIRQVVQYQLMAVHLERRALTVDHDAGQVEVFTIQSQRLHGQVGVAANAHAVEHAGFDGVQIKR